MSKIMDAKEFGVNKYGRFGFDETMHDAIDFAESYHEYCKSVEICKNCKFWQNPERYYYGLECVVHRLNTMSNFGCNKFEVINE